MFSEKTGWELGQGGKVNIAPVQKAAAQVGHRQRKNLC